MLFSPPEELGAYSTLWPANALYEIEKHTPNPCYWARDRIRVRVSWRRFISLIFVDWVGVTVWCCWRRGTFLTFVDWVGVTARFCWRRGMSLILVDWIGATVRVSWRRIISLTFVDWVGVTVRCYRRRGISLMFIDWVGVGVRFCWRRGISLIFVDWVGATVRVSWRRVISQILIDWVWDRIGVGVSIFPCMMTPFHTFTLESTLYSQQVDASRILEQLFGQRFQPVVWKISGEPSEGVVIGRIWVPVLCLDRCWGRCSTCGRYFSLTKLSNHCSWGTYAISTIVSICGAPRQPLHPICVAPY